MIITVKRIGDMSPCDSLTLTMEEDEDIIVCVEDHHGFSDSSVQFCHGTGKSPNTMKALRNLMLAIEKDNKEHKQ